MKCNVCSDLGFVLETRIINQFPHEFMLHCECPAGNKWRYDGRKITGDHKSLYFINSVSFRGGEVDIRELPKEWQAEKPERKQMSIKGIMDKMLPERKTKPEKYEGFYL